MPENSYQKDANGFGFRVEKTDEGFDVFWTKRAPFGRHNVLVTLRGLCKQDVLAVAKAYGVKGIEWGMINVWIRGVEPPTVEPPHDTP